MKDNTLVKQIVTMNYEISLVKTQDETYQIVYTANGKRVISEDLRDYNLTSYLFDLKQTELESTDLSTWYPV